MKRITVSCAVAVSVASSPLEAQLPWPAEDASAAINLTSIEGPEPNDFWTDLSGATFNALTRTLWVCRNGPTASTSKLWALVAQGGTYTVDYQGALRGEWTGFGDFESVTQADWSEPVVYALVEGEERIKEYDVSVYGSLVMNNDWNTRPYLPLAGGLGAEGLTFVPDAFLADAGFVDASGQPCVSHGGMHGLMFVGHQNGGALFVFDLDRSSGTFAFIGEYRTARSETAGLEFDRSTGLLYAYHDDADILAVFDLTSTPVAGQSYRSLHVVREFLGPDHGNNEGIAITPARDCHPATRSLFLTVDDGADRSLLWFEEFADGCEFRSPRIERLR